MLFLLGGCYIYTLIRRIFIICRFKIAILNKQILRQFSDTEFSDHQEKLVLSFTKVSFVWHKGKNIENSVKI